MPYNFYQMPPIPCVSDMWDELQKETRPIVVYGMGNGADKLIRRFEKYGIKISDFFASDGFARGNIFHGFKVKPFSEIKNTYDDFVIVLSFASNKPDVLSMLLEMSEKYDMYIPDMPVAGEEEYFDSKFYNTHYESLIEAYNSLADEDSKNLFAAIVNYKLSGRAEYLFGAYSTKEELYNVLDCNSIESFVDAGAYRGDTVEDALRFFPNLKVITAIEPDIKNFKKLTDYTSSLKQNMSLHNSAVWNEDTDGIFSVSGNRNSTVNATASYEHKTETVSLRKIDSLVSARVDFIKYDVEGAEYEALLGTDETIKKYTPALLVSLYHRSRDIFFLTNMITKKYGSYKLYLRRLLCVPAWEIDLILVKDT